MAGLLFICSSLFLVSLLHIECASQFCTEPCHCSDDLQYVSCDNNSLLDVPHGLPLYAITLDLSWNFIKSINTTDFQSVRHVESINLSHNLVSHISVAAFQQNYPLARLNLNNNHLTAIPGKIFGETNSLTILELAYNQIRSIRPGDIVFFKNLNVLNLTGNRIMFLQSFVFELLPKLTVFELGENRLTGTFKLLTRSPHNLTTLKLANNNISSIFLGSTGDFPRLHMLDLSWNKLPSVDPDWFVSMMNLVSLFLSGNPIGELNKLSFSNCQNLKYLNMNQLPILGTVDENVLSDLHQLQELDLSSNQNLAKIHPLAFSNLNQLEVLQLYNNSLSSLSSSILKNLSYLKFLRLRSNPWNCDCQLSGFVQILNEMIESGLNVDSEFVCARPEMLQNQPVLSIGLDNLYCEVSYKIGSVGVIDCPVYETHMDVVWVTNHLVQYRLNLSEAEKFDLNGSLSSQNMNNRFSVLSNGSLLIRGIERSDGGSFICIAGNQHGNSSSVTIVKLDYEIIPIVMLQSIMIGFSAAAAFFAVAAVFGAIRKCAFSCSKAERAKRKSIHEVLNTIRNGSQLDRFSAYRTAKMDQFSAFRSATMDQLSAFTSAKISKLRTYKQMSVTNVLQHLERMRQHYVLQTAKIKENCSSQVDRLRENYVAQREKLRGQRSQHIRKIRDNYNAQALRIREYRLQQMSRLREQYKQQQQHLLKLLELLDIGNCITVIEAECIRTESIIFDADIACDDEAQSIHVPQDQESNLSLELNDIGTDISESSSMMSDRISVSALNDTVDKLEAIQFGDNELNDVAADIVFDSPVYLQEVGKVSDTTFTKDVFKGIVRAQIEKAFPGDIQPSEVDAIQETVL